MSLGCVHNCSNQVVRVECVIVIITIQQTIVPRIFDELLSLPLRWFSDVGGGSAIIFMHTSLVL